MRIETAIDFNPPRTSSECHFRDHLSLLLCVLSQSAGPDRPGVTVNALAREALGQCVWQAATRKPNTALMPSYLPMTFTDEANEIYDANEGNEVFNCLYHLELSIW